MKKVCKYCGKELKRGRWKVKPSLAKRCPNLAKRGWVWEDSNAFKKRLFCDNNRFCFGKWGAGVGFTNWVLTHKKWSKEKILSEFKKIKDGQKCSSRWMLKKYPKLYYAISYYWFYKNGSKGAFWNKFIKEAGLCPVHDFINPYYRKIASKLLKYWKQELDYDLGCSFEYSKHYGLPIDGYEKYQPSDIQRGIDYLKKVKAVRLLKRGGGTARHTTYPSKYKLLKTRI